MTRTDPEQARDRSTLADVRDAMQELAETIWRLRQPDGCPWDRVQTHRSIADDLVEEAYEAVDAIEEVEVRGPDHLREELGDVLMQVLLHAQIAADAGEFDLADVARGLNEKLVRRHPHVFGTPEQRAAGPEEVKRIWAQVKLDEKAARDRAAAGRGLPPEGLLDTVPRALPALKQAQKVSKKAAAAGFDWPDSAAVWEKADEERTEYLAEAPGTERAAEEFGDLLFSLVNVARKDGVDAEAALRASTGKFRRRWSAMEAAARAKGRDLDDGSFSHEELEALWEAAKQEVG